MQTTRGVEWGGDGGHAGRPTDDLSKRGWPILRPSDAEPCDGREPQTGARCVLGYHNGYHRDTGGAEWLDD